MTKEEYTKVREELKRRTLGTGFQSRVLREFDKIAAPLVSNSVYLVCGQILTGLEEDQTSVVCAYPTLEAAKKALKTDSDYDQFDNCWITEVQIIDTV